MSKVLKPWTPLIYDGSSRLLLPSTRSRNCLSFISDAQNIIFHFLMRSSHSFFLFKSQESLLRSIGISMKDLVSILLYWLGHLVWFSWCWEKNVQRSFRIDTEYLWKGWVDNSKILFAAWIESVTTMILEISLLLVAWLMPHLIVKSSASVLVTFRVWWRVFVIGLSRMWICEIEVATLFLMLASVIMSAEEGESEDSRANLSSYWMWDLMFWLVHLLNRWKEKWLEQVSMILLSEKSSRLRRLKDEKTSLK